MKAKEYYEKYKRPIINDFANKKTELVQALVAELYNEPSRKSRHLNRMLIRRLSAFASSSARYSIALQNYLNAITDVEF